jgi:hypothetical protein
VVGSWGSVNTSECQSPAIRSADDDGEGWTLGSTGFRISDLVSLRGLAPRAFGLVSSLTALLARFTFPSLLSASHRLTREFTVPSAIVPHNITPNLTRTTRENCGHFVSLVGMLSAELSCSRLVNETLALGSDTCSRLNALRSSPRAQSYSRLKSW